MTQQQDFQITFEQLKAILQPYQNRLKVVADTTGNYYLNTRFSEKWQKELMFGAVKIQKRYVSFYLFPLYMCPDLVAQIPPGLLKRMQGKSCFNFTTIDEDRLLELTELTRRGFERFQREGLVVQ